MWSLLKSEQWSLSECSWCYWLQLGEQFVLDRRLINFMVTWYQLRLLSFIWINWCWVDSQVGFQIITTKPTSDWLIKTVLENLVSVIGGALNLYIMIGLDMNFISIVSWANYINSWFSYFNSWANYFGDWADWFGSWF